MRDDATTCVRCGHPLTDFRVTHFEAGRRSITLEPLCTTHACEAYVRPGAQLGAVADEPLVG